MLVFEMAWSQPKYFLFAVVEFDGEFVQVLLSQGIFLLDFGYL